MEEISTTRTEEETLLALLRRADALNIAYAAVEPEQWANAEMKAEMLEALEEMCAEAEEWFVSYRRALGIPDPLACRDGQGAGILRGVRAQDYKEEA